MEDTDRFKFKLWDTQENKWYEPIYNACYGELDDISIGLNGSLSRRTLEGEFHESSRFPNRYIIIQSTGLKDNNGKLIYEGDRLRIKHLIKKEKYPCDSIYEVGFDILGGIKFFFIELYDKSDKLLQFPIHRVLDCRYGGLDYKMRGTDYFPVLRETHGENHMSRDRWIINHESDDIKIIGNKFENPEVLENKQNKQNKQNDK